MKAGREGMRLLKITLFILLFGMSVLAVANLVRKARAEYLFKSATSIGGLEHARQLDPWRAEIAQEIGDAWLAVMPPRPGPAALAYREAARLKPYDALYWLGLAHSSLRLDQTTPTLRALAAAEAVDPVNQIIQMEEGNIYLELGDQAQGLAHHARAIALSHALTGNLCPYYLGLGLTPCEVAERLLGRNPQLLESFLNDQLAGAIEPAEAGRLWQYVNAEAGSLRGETYRAYFNYLLGRRDFAGARALWGAIAQKFYQRPWDGAAEPFWNGDLALKPKFSGGLEWQISDRLPEGCAVELGTPDPASRAPALALRFDGTQNAAFAHVRHGFFVEPGRSYTLRCPARTNQITTDNGLYLAVSLAGEKPQSFRSRVLTESGSGEVSITFAAPAGCGWGELTICRDFSTRFNNKIKGEAWFGPFMLEAAPVARKEPPSP